VADVRFKLKRPGLLALLKGEEIQAVLEDMGGRVAAAAGPGHDVEPWVGRVRARVTVRTATPAAMEAEATDRTLTAAINAARL